MSCYTTGDVVVTTTGVKEDSSLLGDVVKFLEDPTEVIVNALDLNLKFSLEDFGGHFEFDVAFGGFGQYTAWKMKFPLGEAIDVCS